MKLSRMDRSLLASPADWHARLSAQVTQFPLPSAAQQRRLFLLANAGELVQTFQTLPKVLEHRARWIDEECLGPRAVNNLRRVRPGVSAERALVNYLRDKTGSPHYRQTAELLSLVFDVAVPPRSRRGSAREKPSFDPDMFEERVGGSRMPAFAPERVRAFADLFFRSRMRT
jgi:hypothetical protein